MARRVGEDELENRSAIIDHLQQFKQAWTEEIRQVVLMPCQTRDWEYVATLLKNGTISFNGERYETPSAAVIAAVGQSTNGWAFWHYKHKNGD